MALFKTKHDADLSPTARLMIAMGFGGKDLDLNRAGELTPKQKTRLRQTELEGWMFLFGCWIFVLMFGFVAAYQQMHGRFDNFQVPFFAYLLLGSGIIGPVLLYRRWQRLKTVYITAFTGRVKKHEGPVYNLLLVIDYERRTEAIYSVDRLMYEAFLDGETYTLYSSSVSPNIISTAEHVLTRE